MIDEQYIQIDKESFDLLRKEIIPELIKDKCDFCDEPITRDNFGLLAKNITSCNNIICLMEAIEKFEEEKKEIVFTPEEIENIKDCIQSEDINQDKIEELKKIKDKIERDPVALARIVIDCLSIMKQNSEVMSSTEEERNKIESFVKSFDIKKLKDLFYDYKDGKGYGDYWKEIEIKEEIDKQREKYLGIPKIFFQIFSGD